MANSPTTTNVGKGRKQKNGNASLKTIGSVKYVRAEEEITKGLPVYQYISGSGCFSSFFIPAVTGPGDTSTNVLFIKKNKTVQNLVSGIKTNISHTNSRTAVAVSPVNGDTAVVTSDATHDVQISIYNSKGRLQTSITVDTFIATDVNIKYMTTGDFVASWGNTTAVKFAKYTNVGTIVGTIKTITTNVTKLIHGLAVSPINNNVVLAYANGVNGYFGRYDNTLTIIDGPTVFTTVDSLIAISAAFSPTTGDFVITGSNSAGATGYCKFSSTSVQQVSYATVENTGNSTALQTYVDFLDNGDFVIAYTMVSANFAVNYARYNSAGTLQGSLVRVKQGSGLTYVTVANVSGGFVIAYGGTAGLYYNKYASDGTLEYSDYSIEQISITNRIYSDSSDGAPVLSYGIATEPRYTPFKLINRTTIRFLGIADSDALDSEYFYVKTKGTFEWDRVDESYSLDFRKNGGSSAVVSSRTIRGKKKARIYLK